MMWSKVLFAAGALVGGCLLNACASAASPKAAAVAAPATVQAVAQNDPACRALGDFYWEIGDARGVLASGQIGSAYGANTPVKVASASKWVFGAYALEKLGRQGPNDEQLAMLQMRSGYTHFNPFKCLRANTVDGCMLARGNDERVAADVGKFSYGGGHSQKLAQGLGLGGYNAAQMTAELRRYLGSDIGIEYAQPQPAGGMRGTPAAYGHFLRKILGGQLRMRDYLGYKPVCTKCAEAKASPAGGAWHYSLNHWVEDDAQGDGAFSSPGLMGFYPWISADKTTYGLVARQKLSRSAYQESADCGRQIRRAWLQAR